LRAWDASALHPLRNIPRLEQQLVRQYPLLIKKFAMMVAQTDLAEIESAIWLFRRAAILK
jgi:hypothetical protein